MIRTLLLLSLIALPLAAAHGDEEHGDPLWASPIMFAGESYERSFDEVRAHRFYDEATAFEGEVVVTVDAPQAVTIMVTDQGFQPPSIELAPGGTATWFVDGDDENWHNVISRDEIAPSEDSPAPAIGLLLVALALITRR